MTANIQIPSVLESNVPVASSAGRSRIFLDQSDGLIKLKDYLGNVTPVGSSGGLTFTSTYAANFAAEANKINFWDPTQTITATLPAAPSNNTKLSFLADTALGVGGDLTLDAGTNDFLATGGGPNFYISPEGGFVTATFQFQQTAGPGVGVWQVVDTDLMFLLTASQTGALTVNGTSPVVVTLSDDAVLGSSNGGGPSDIPVPSHSVLLNDGLNGLAPLTLPQNTILGRAGGDVVSLVPNEVEHILYSDPTSFQSVGVSGTQNNYAPGSWDTAWVTELNSSNAIISGFSAPTAAGRPFRRISTPSTSTSNLTIRHAGSGSLAANQVYTPLGEDLVLGPGDSAFLVYDFSILKWGIQATQQNKPWAQSTATTIGPNLVGYSGTRGVVYKYDNSANVAMVIQLYQAFAYDGLEVEIKEVGGSSNPVSIIRSATIGTANLELLSGGVGTADIFTAPYFWIKYKYDLANTTWRVVGKANTGPVHQVTTVTGAASYSAHIDELVPVNVSAGAVTVTLPTAVGVANREIWVKLVSAATFTCTINTTSSQTIDGSLTMTLTTDREWANLRSDGANWMQIG